MKKKKKLKASCGGRKGCAIQYDLPTMKIAA